MSDMYMDQILNGMDDLIAAMDIKFNFIYFNDAYKYEFKKIFGPDIVVGDNILTKLKHLPIEQKQAEEIWGRAVKGETFTVIQQFGDIDKERNTYEIKYSSVKNENGIIIGASHNVRDVSIRENLKQKNNTLLKSKQKFMSSVSHELRTPMNAILGFAQLLKYDNNKTNAHTYTKSIIRSGKYLLNLINDTLDYNKIHEGVLSISLESVNAFNTIFEIFSDLQVLANDKDVTLWMNCEKHKHINLYVDKQRYKQILINLISNAIKYNKLGGMVELNSEVKDGFFTIHILDTGYGITEENIEKIGTPFERFGMENSNIQGTGLGLSITKMICNMMNGKFNVKSTMGKGSVFSVGFAIDNNKCTNHEDIYDFDDDMNINEKNNVNKNFIGSILYVEDNEFNLMLMDSIIKKNYPLAQYKYIQNGYEAFNYIKKNLPDIILLDINVPDMSGIDILKSMRNMKQFDKCKIIMISADVTDNIDTKCIVMGANGYFSKPLTIPLFVNGMNNIINSIKV